jgi:hypothetical protein
MKDLDLEYPKPSKEHLQELGDAKKLLESEK